MLIVRFVVSYTHMSEETQTPQIERQNDTDPLDDALAMQRASEAARRINTSNEAEPVRTTSPSERARMGKTATRFMVVGSLVGAAVTGAMTPTLVDALDGPNLSTDTREFTVGNGESTYDAAEAVYGSETADISAIASHIESSPVNIDVLKDGLQPGETLIIPDRVETK